MSKSVEKLLEIARGEIGYHEKATNANLDQKTALNDGSGNYTKYARDLHNAGYYNGNKNGYDWCDVFVDWCFWMLCGKNKKEAENMECQSGDLGAGCTWSAQYYQQAGRYYTRNPQPGDQIFFGDFDHTGIVESVTEDAITTIEGNTSSQVARRTYSRYDGWITGFGRPKFESGSAKPTPPEKPEEKPANKKVNVEYRVRGQKNDWYSPVKNLEDYAGLSNDPITDVAIKVSEGKIKYRVHVIGKGWLPYVTGYNINDAENGFAGDNRPIDAIEVYYYTPDNIRPYKRAKYRVSAIGMKYFDWQHDNETSGNQDGYAGLYGYKIDRLQIVIE